MGCAPPAAEASGLAGGFAAGSAGGAVGGASTRGDSAMADVAAGVGLALLVHERQEKPITASNRRITTSGLHQ
jgi:hypothetical protein